MNVKFVVDITTPTPPERVHAALVDFTERRPILWPGLSDGIFRAHSVGDHSAEVTEGSDMGPIQFWARETYDWSTPGVVRWTVRESNFCLPNHTMEVRIAPAGSGSRVQLYYDRATFGLKGLLAGCMMSLIGKSMMTKYYSDALGNM